MPFPNARFGLNLLVCIIKYGNAYTKVSSLNLLADVTFVLGLYIYIYRGKFVCLYIYIYVYIGKLYSTPPPT